MSEIQMGLVDTMLSEIEVEDDDFYVAEVEDKTLEDVVSEKKEAVEDKGERTGAG